MKNKVGLGFTFCTVHRFAGLIHGRSLLSRILGLLLVWEGTVLAAQSRLENKQAVDRLLSPLKYQRVNGKEAFR